jgi:hypothetical protein
MPYPLTSTCKPPKGEGGQRCAASLQSLHLPTGGKVIPRTVVPTGTILHAQGYVR